MSNLYNYPKYYEIAFSFRDIPSEVDVFEECFKLFSRIPVKQVLELGCGNCPHLEELIERDYEYNGLDLSKSMLEYSRRKVSRIDARVNLIQADMLNFSLEFRVDFVYVLLGSLFATSTDEVISHFNSVARALKKGGLYLLDWCVQFTQPLEDTQSWKIEKEGIKVQAKYLAKLIGPVEQIFEESIFLKVNDHGKHHTITGKDVKRAIYPQEFLHRIDALKSFEFVGWWNNWDLSQPLEKVSKVNRPIILVRRK